MPPGVDPPRRFVRLLVTATVYVAGAVLVRTAALRAARLFVLPVLFDTLIEVMLGVGLVLALAVAWRFESIR